jgi:ribonuclease-3
MWGVWQRLKTWGSGGGIPKDLDAMLRKEFGLKVRNRSFYDEALRHASMLDGDTSGRMSNERLEFLGDTVLDLVVAGFLFRQFPTEQEGALTQRKSKIVNRKTLNLLGTRLGLPRFITSKMRRSDVQETVIGNALEALIGAMYLDHGFEATRTAVLSMLRKHGAIDKIHETVDFKSNLHHWAQRGKQTIEFRVVRELSDGSGYDMEVRIGGKVMGTGFGRSKKDAEQVAARQAWKAVYDREQAPEPVRSARSEEPERSERSEQSERSERSDRSDRPDASRRRERPARAGRSTRVTPAADETPATQGAPKETKEPRAPRPPREPRATAPAEVAPPVTPAAEATPEAAPRRERIRDRVRKRAEARTTAEEAPVEVLVSDAAPATEEEKKPRSGNRRGGRRRPKPEGESSSSES